MNYTEPSNSVTVAVIPQAVQGNQSYVLGGMNCRSAGFILPGRFQQLLLNAAVVEGCLLNGVFLCEITGLFCVS